MADTPAPSLPTKRTVLNKVMILIGSAKRVSDSANPQPGSDEESLASLWDIARRAAITLHPFNFALTREKLYREAGEPSDIGPAYRYKIPANWLCWFPWDRDSDFYFEAVDEGGYLLTDEPGPIVARGGVDVQEVARWSPLFVEVMAYTVAVEFCQGKTQLLGLRDRLANERQEKLDEAFRVDGRATQNRKRPSHRQSGWAGARFRHLGHPR